METDKEIELVKQQSLKAFTTANQLIITNNEEMLEAGNILKRVKQVGKMIKERKEEITKPMNDALKSVRSLFKPIEDQQEKAQEIVSEKMIKFQKEQDLLAQKIRYENETKLKDTGKDVAHRYDNLKLVPDVIKKSEDFHTRIVGKMRIIDETKIPDEYWIVDEVKLRKDVLSGKVVDGAEYYEEKIIV